MKYTITLNLLKMKEFNLNPTKWAIMEVISYAATWAKTEIVDDEIYYWISRTKIKEELEVFDLKDDTIYRYLKYLHNNDFIEYRKVGRKDLIKMKSKGKMLFTNGGYHETQGKTEQKNYNKNQLDNQDLKEETEKKNKSEKNPRKVGKKSEKSRKKIREKSEKNPTDKYTYNIKSHKDKNTKDKAKNSEDNQDSKSNKDNKEYDSSTVNDSSSSLNSCIEKENNVKVNMNDNSEMYRWMNDYLNKIASKSKMFYKNRFNYENVITYLISLFGFETVKNVMEWGMKDDFWKNIIIDHYAVKRNFEKMKGFYEAKNKSKLKPMPDGNKKVKKVKNVIEKLNNQKDSKQDDKQLKKDEIIKKFKKVLELTEGRKLSDDEVLELYYKSKNRSNQNLDSEIIDAEEC